MFEKKLVYDIEVLPKYFLFVAKVFNEDCWQIILNNKELMRKFWEKHQNSDWLWMGYNVHNYDDKVIRWFLNGGNPYEASQNIIYQKQWPINKIKNFFKFYSYDAFTRIVDKNMSFGVSLKTLEGYMGVSIDESSISFFENRELTKEEINELINYCKSDVINTERVINIQNELTGDLDSRIGMCEMVNNPNLINMTKARAAITILQGNYV